MNQNTFFHGLGRSRSLLGATVIVLSSTLGACGGSVTLGQEVGGAGTDSTAGGAGSSTAGAGGDGAGGSPGDGAGGSAGDGAGGSGAGAGGVQNAGTGGGAPSDDCTAVAMGYKTFSTKDELDALLIRRWKRCSGPTILGEEVGVEFADDGRFYPLYRDGSGAIVRRIGIDPAMGEEYGGTWVYDPPSQEPPAKAWLQLRGTLTSPPDFTADPLTMRILFSPVYSRFKPLDP